MPSINDEFAIYIDSNPVVRCSFKTVNSCLKFNLTAPSHREVVSWQFFGGRIKVPIKFDHSVVAGHRGVAKKLLVVPILTLPIGIGSWTNSLPPNTGNRLAAPLVIIYP